MSFSNTSSNTSSTANAMTAATVDATETAAHCLRAAAELQGRLASSWLENFSKSLPPRGTAVAAPWMMNWSLEAMRLTAETALRNIEMCQQFAQRAAGGKE